jgi:hypothetical protein
MYKKTSVFGFLWCFLYGYLIYLSIDAALFWLTGDYIFPFSARFVVDLPFVFIADRLNLNESAVNFIQLLLYGIIFLVPGFVFSLKTAVTGLKQPNEFRKKQSFAIFFIIFNLVVLAIGITSIIPLDEPFLIEFDRLSICVSAAFIISLPFFIADLIKNKKDLINKSIK